MSINDKIAAAIRAHHTHSSLEWEHGLRDGVQLVSELMSYHDVMNALKNIQKTEPLSAQNCFQLVESRQVKGQYRIAVDLPSLAKISESTQQQTVPLQTKLEVIADFLNKNLNPDAKDPVWKVDARYQAVYCFKQSSAYKVYRGTEPTPKDPWESFFDDFIQLKKAGLTEPEIEKLKATITLTPDRYGKIASFSDPKIYDELYYLIRCDQEREKAYTRAATAAVLDKVNLPGGQAVPYDVGEKIGEHLDRKTGASLAQVCTAATKEAKAALRRIDEKEESDTQKPKL